MSDYADLLDAAIARLLSMREEGVRFLPLEESSLEVLRKSPSKPRLSTPAARPAAPRPTFARSADQKPGAPAAPAIPAFLPAAAPVPAAPRPALSPLLPPGVKGQQLSPEEKRKYFEELKARAMVCQNCSSLAATRRNVVFGAGSIDADLMFIGEAPGWDEDEQGEPFVGKAGQLLTKIIQTMGLSREQVYIANILKCRPDTPGKDFGNRPPTAKEMEACLPYLHAQIDLIRPKMMVALGSTAVTGLFGPIGSMTRARGKFKEYRGIPTMLTYHPSYLLRPNVNNVKREVWEDMLQVMEALNLPISEKQRGYFLK
jgi:DNA polymerase